MQILTYVFDAHCRFRTGKVLMDASINLGKDSRESSLSTERMRKAQKTADILHILQGSYILAQYDECEWLHCQFCHADMAQR